MEQCIPQDLDLSGGPEARVELDRVVRGVVGQGGLGGAVGPEIVLQTIEEGGGPRLGGFRMLEPAHGHTLGLDVGQLQRRLAVETPPAAEQRVIGQGRGGVVRSQPHRAVGRRGVGLEQPLGVEMGRLQQEDVDLPGRGHRPGHVEERAGGQEGEPEQHQAGREVQQVVAGMETLEDRRQALGRAGLVDPGPDPMPEPGLPDGVVVEGPPGAVDQVVLGPLAHHVRAVQVVPVEQVGDATALGIERGALALAFQGGQPGGERSVVSLTDGLQHRPDHPLDPPGIGLIRRPVHGQDRAAQVTRVGPDDVGGDAVAGPRARGTEMPGQLEGEPATHPVGRHGQPLRRERIRGRHCQDLGQSRGQRTGPAR